MNKFSVTLKDLRENRACFEGYNRVVRTIQGKEFTSEDANRNTYIQFNHSESISLIEILKSNGLDDVLWTLRCVRDADRDIRLYAVWCARQAQHLMKDVRSINALESAERYANGEVTDEDLKTAEAAAEDAARAARAAWDAAWAAAWAAGAAEDAALAAWDAAWDAAWAAGAAWDAAKAAARAAGDARAAAWAAARAAAWATARAAGDARAAQKEMFIKMCNGTSPWQISEPSSC